MLIFTYKLENYIKKKILPNLLLVSGKYIIKGSFKRKIPYITDIDIVNNVYPEINLDNIYDEILKLIGRIHKDPNIILIYVTCGTDDRFKINNGSDEEFNEMCKLLDKKDSQKFIAIMEKYSTNTDKKIFLISEIIWKYYKLRWTWAEIINNKKILVSGVIVNFTDQIAKNTSLLLQYYVKIQSYPVGVDAVINYLPVDMSGAYQVAADYQLKMANYSREYYYMLFPFKYYFRDKKDIRQDLEYLIEKKFGLYKQLMVRIDSYHTLYNTDNLDIGTASAIVASIVKDLKYLPGNFKSNTVDEIKSVAENSTPEEKMKMWLVLLKVLYDDINAAANTSAREYFFKYLNMLPEDIQSKYYFNWRSINHRKNI